MAGAEEDNKKPSASATGSKPRSKADLTTTELGTDKLYFKIGEVAEIVGVAPHVLRFWETEFRGVRPQKSRNQQRVYRRRDVELLLQIKYLLYEQRFTIAGARQQLASGEAIETADPSPSYRLRHSAARVRERLDALASLLRSEPQCDPLSADPAAFVERDQGIRALLDPAGKDEDLKPH
ncbi:MAG: MerR family transcriptional regulator [Myxococcales bacterium FL481]|nr:MAG: MerR family transcriptional regulator [Myxococcales bacterium FL481]